MDTAELIAKLPRATKRPSFWLGAVLVLSVARGLPYYDYVPMWDSMIYADCIAGAAERRLTFANLNCAEHPTAAYAAWLAAPQRLFGVHYAWDLVMNLALGAAALWAFYGILQRQSRGERSSAELVLMTAVLSVCPVVLANAVNFSPDYGVYCFFLLFLNALLRDRRITPLVFGTCLVFSKEVGVLLYALAVLVKLTLELVPRQRRVGPWLLRGLWLSVPLALFGLYVLTRTKTGGPGLWAGLGVKAVLANLIAGLSFSNAVFQTYLICIGVLQFTWIATAVIGLGWLEGMRRFACRLVGLGGRGTRPTLVCAALLLGSAFFLTLFKTFCNVRYFLALAPLILWAFYEGLRTVVRWPWARVAVIGALGTLFLASNYFTLDPVSKRLFGTWRFGSHKMLRMVSRTGECCCSAGRDQLAYNLQHVQFHYLEQMALYDLKGRDGEPVVFDPTALWHNLRPMEHATMKRTLSAEPAYTPVSIDEPTAAQAAEGRSHIHYMVLPNCRNDAFRTDLLRLYDVARTRTYRRRGYSMEVLELDRKR